MTRSRTEDCVVTTLHRREAMRRYYQKNRVMLNGKSRLHYQKTRQAVSIKNADARKKDAAEMWTAYGGECVCCGEKEPRFFELDHIFSDGHKEKKKTASGNPWRPTSVVIWRRHRVADRARFQILCSNCNSAKSQHGNCPHMEWFLA